MNHFHSRVWVANSGHSRSGFGEFRAWSGSHAISLASMSLFIVGQGFFKLYFNSDLYYPRNCPSQTNCMFFPFLRPSPLTFFSNRVYFSRQASFKFQCGSALNNTTSSPSKSLGLLPMSMYCLLELGCSMYDFTWSKLRKNRAQGIRTKVIGKHHFLCLNIIACLLRLFLWFYYFNTGTRAFANARICDVSNSFGNSILGLIGALLCTLLAGSLTVLKTDSPIGVRSLAKSNARRSLAQSTPTPTPTLAEHELFSTLSLARPTSSPLSEIDTFHSHTVAEGGTHTSPSRLSVEPAFGKLTSLQGKFTEPGTAWNSPSPRKDISGQMDMSMDWEPSPDRDSQSNDILLRPQTFLPPLPFREETGIEELFQSHVKLVEGDDHQLDKKKAGWLEQLFNPTIKKQ
ncbi:hypothetical protein Pst134EB_008794 [Puccinia striiformis f. sp. tritici]|nr:hypothetical protein Pst134EB_008794 [Puccinia striiformis f. sp. tritici]